MFVISPHLLTKGWGRAAIYQDSITYLFGNACCSGIFIGYTVDAGSKLTYAEKMRVHPPGERTKAHWDKSPLGQKPTGQYPTGQKPTA